MISSGRRRYVWDRASQSVYRSPKQFPRPARLRATPSTPPASRSSRTVLFPSARGTRADRMIDQEYLLALQASPLGTEQVSVFRRRSASRHKADVLKASPDVRFWA